jgi:group I intron endonuclease
MLIYGIKNRDSGNVVYVGQTIRSLIFRFNQHLKAAEKGELEYPLYRAMRKYGIDKFEAFTIEECSTVESLDKREKELILEFNTLTPNGYNLMLGRKNGRHSRETIEKIRKSAISNEFGKWKRSEEDNEKNRKRALKQHLDPTKRISFLKGNGSKEFNVYRITKIKREIRKSQAVYEIGEFVGTFLDVVKFAKEFNLNSGVITQVLRKEKKTHKGLIFEYKEN